jgi:hypothetical protein
VIGADDFLSQAKWLLNKNSASEVDFRSAISRAYYSLYHECFSRLKERYRPEFIHQIFALSYQDHGLAALEKHLKHEELDEEYILSLRISLHKLLPNILRTINFNYFMEYKQHRKKRNIADYNLKTKMDYEFAKVEVESISNLILAIKNL